jgi:hydrogenase expression/formation protein HypE
MGKQADRILLGHGSGGQLMHDLIASLFVRYFSNPILDQQSDSALLKISTEHLAFTTDAFVVDPIFFPGGDIGKLAVCGTVNDIAVAGARPLYISCSFILEEGLPFDSLEKIVRSMANEAKKAGVQIVTGDTKVVNKGKCDKIFISTAGIGEIQSKYQSISTGESIVSGDKIIINGSIGDHGMAVMSARNDLNLRSNIMSDCASLNGLIDKALQASDRIKFMRDATRGGLATILAELSRGKPFGVLVEEDRVGLKENVRGICELLGFDPLYVANEGKVLLVVGKEDAEKVLGALKSHELGKDSAIIGEVVSDHPGKSWINTAVGGKRIIDVLSGEQLPRIC